MVVRYAVTVGGTQRACRVPNCRMRLPGGRQAQVVRGHDQGKKSAQAPPEAERITRIPPHSQKGFVSASRSQCSKWASTMWM